MSDERGGDRERHAAQITLVRFLSCVSPLVICQRAGLSERLTTDVTHVRFLPAVQPAENANTNINTTLKLQLSFGTLLSFVTFQQESTAVPDVYFVVGRGSKLETTALTGVRLLLSMVHSAVSNQLALLSKTLVTVTATKRLLSCNRHQGRKHTFFDLVLNSIYQHKP